jgi:hypothetical protein
MKHFWDCFHGKGMQRPILGYEFSIDTGTATPVCCKQPRYGPHEAIVLRKLVREPEDKGIIDDDDDGPWAAQVVLAAKPNQGHVHYSQYRWRLCVSYRALNAITRPFKAFVTRCVYAVSSIGKSTCFITLDLDAGYWQVILHPASSSKTAFYVPDEKNGSSTCLWAY